MSLSPPFTVCPAVSVSYKTCVLDERRRGDTNQPCRCPLEHRIHASSHVCRERQFYILMFSFPFSQWLYLLKWYCCVFGLRVSFWELAVPASKCAGEWGGARGWGGASGWGGAREWGGAVPQRRWLGRGNVTEFLQGQIGSVLICVYFNRCQVWKGMHWFTVTMATEAPSRSLPLNRQWTHSFIQVPQNSIMCIPWAVNSSILTECCCVFSKSIQ